MAEEKPKVHIPRVYKTLNPGTGWRERLTKAAAAFTDRNLDDVHTDMQDKVYGMALEGSRLTTIAAYFGIEYAAFSGVYKDVWQAGNAELEALIAQDTVEYGLESRIPVAKIWLGKSLGGLGEGKSVDVENDSDDGEVNIKVNIIRRSEDE